MPIVLIEQKVNPVCQKMVEKKPQSMLKDQARPVKTILMILYAVINNYS
jgi:hypothetical protein